MDKVEVKKPVTSNNLQEFLDLISYNQFKDLFSQLCNVEEL